jgi:hypothetical protein
MSNLCAIGARRGPSGRWATRRMRNALPRGLSVAVLGANSRRAGLTNKDGFEPAAHARGTGILSKKGPEIGHIGHYFVVRPVGRESARRYPG